MNRSREPSWQTYGEIVGPKLELQRKIFQEIIMKSFRVIKILNTIPNTIDEKNSLPYYNFILLMPQEALKTFNAIDITLSSYTLSQGNMNIL